MVVMVCLWRWWSVNEPKRGIMSSRGEVMLLWLDPSECQLEKVRVGRIGWSWPELLDMLRKEKGYPFLLSWEELATIFSRIIRNPHPSFFSLQYQFLFLERAGEWFQNLDSFFRWIMPNCRPSFFSFLDSRYHLTSRSALVAVHFIFNINN